MGAATHFDVFLCGVSPTVASRQQLLHDLASHLQIELERSDQAVFVAGARVRIQRALDAEAAFRSRTALERLGALIELEPHRPEAALVGLDDLTAVPAQAATADDTPASLDAMRASLKSLYAAAGGQRTVPVGPGAATAASAFPAAEDWAAAAEPQNVLTELTGDVAESAPLRLAGPSPGPAPDREARFRPPEIAQAQLLLEVARPPARAVEPAPPDNRREPARCPTHGQLLLDGACDLCVSERPVPGRLFRGALRRRPLARLGAGLALGLLLGWIGSSPYADRAERRVAELRAQANLDRYRPLEEARQNTRRLDAEAESQSSRAAVGTIAIWLIVAAAVVAGWHRVT